MLLVGCGTYRPNKIAFYFTPVPVLTLDAVAGGTPVSIDPATCGVFVADEVDLTLDPTRQAAFEQWLDDIGFTIRYSRLSERYPRLTYLVQVPAGSVPDAVALIRKQRGVLTADPNSFFYAREAASPGVSLLGCQARR